ncbi:MAG: hypothetical protein IT449_03230 [Phycisphaerales bacterium]|nr:hypothetical protein [Phycisphaerales bacterium]
MSRQSIHERLIAVGIALGGWFLWTSGGAALAQLTDWTQTPNTAGVGIAKSFEQEIGAGRGDVMTPESSIFIIERDPFRSIRRGRQLFQRKFTIEQGNGPRTGDGVGNIELDASVAAGLSDSCASCHGRPRGAAGAGGDVFTRPDSRDAPHLFGLGLVEMLGDEITRDLRAIREEAIAQAKAQGQPVTLPLISKGIGFGSIIGLPDGGTDASQVDGVNPDLRVRPFFHHGGTISIREFVVGALNAEMGLEAPDPDLLAASGGADVITPSGMVLSGSTDAIEAPPVSNPKEDCDGDGVVNEIPTAIVDHLEFYLLNYFKAGTYDKTGTSKRGLQIFKSIGCTDCHVQNLLIEHDRRVADVETEFDKSEPGFNRLFATASPLFETKDDGSGLPLIKAPRGASFLVRNIFADFKRHDLGSGFHERNFDGTVTTEFMTEPLWGVATTAPYGHDGRSVNLTEVIMRHGGEALGARDAFDKLSASKQAQVLAFLNTLVLFPPDDTASNLYPGDPDTPGFPQFGHGSINLGTLFNDPSDRE